LCRGRAPTGSEVLSRGGRTYRRLPSAPGGQGLAGLPKGRKAPPQSPQHFCVGSGGGGFLSSWRVPFMTHLA
jgi:hypothetical protein